MIRKAEVLLSNGQPTGLNLHLGDKVIQLPVKSIELRLANTRRPGTIRVELAVERIQVSDIEVSSSIEVSS